MRKPNFCFLKSVPFLACILGIGSSSLNWAMNMPISLFPLENHEQNIDAWIEVTDSEYRKPLLDPTYQKERLKEFYNHYFSTDEKSLSPWGKAYLDQQISRDPNLKFLKKTIKDLMKKMKDPKYIGYGENFRPYQKEWFEKIASNMDLEQLGQNLIFDPKQRGILIQNTFARVLPTSDAYFYSFELPGEGYPFDNLQESALWVGTPIYIIGQTQDKQWSLIVAPELTAWIPTAATARVNEQFIKTWQKCAHTKLAAISETNISITDLLNGDYLFKAYVGAVFPVVEERAGNLKILVPLRDFKGNARIRYSLLTKRQAALMPMIATPENFIRLIKTLQNRPYGWGGSYFYNDCSAELKSLYTPFGIWLPRHSTDQVSAGKMIDKRACQSKNRIFNPKRKTLDNLCLCWTARVFVFRKPFEYTIRKTEFGSINLSESMGLKAA
jgi:hypothetical protein